METDSVTIRPGNPVNSPLVIPPGVALRLRAGTPGVSTPVNPDGNGLRVGVVDSYGLIGKGPKGTAIDLPHYGVVMGIPSSTTNADLPALLAAAAAVNVHVILILVHSPTAFCDVVGNCKNFSRTKYADWLDKSAVFPEVAAALAAKRASVHVVDEPFASYFCNSITPADINWMCRQTKDRFPGAICLVRATTNVFKTSLRPPEGWLADYAWAQYGKYPTGSTLPGESAVAYFARQKAAMAAQGLGLVVGANLWDSGSSQCWDYLGNGLSTGRIHGTITTGNAVGVGSGAQEVCSTPAQGTYYVAVPDHVRETIDACYNDPDFPLFIMFGNFLSNNSLYPVFNPLQTRPDLVALREYVINKAALRTASNGWRAIKA